MISRRDWLRTMLSSSVGLGLFRCGMAQPLVDALSKNGSHQQLVVLWMAGGPSQMDTFDLKPGHPNGGEFKEIQTSVPGIRICEHLPKLSEWMHQLSIIRSLQTKEGDHGRGTFLVRTGQRPGTPLKYPALPVSLSKELSLNDPMVPDYVSILPPTFINPAAFSSGFLGTRHQPLTVGSQSVPTPNGPPRNAELRVENLLPATSLERTRIERRREMWELLQQTYGAGEREGAARAHDTVFRRAVKLSDSELNVAFDLSKESEKAKAPYGTSQFGQGCLMARRLIERGVPVVEVALGNGGLGWDTHIDNFKSVRNLCGDLDAGWSSLLKDLDERGLLESTTFLWIGEFGRTPTINPQAGRDHFPDAWSCVVGGGGIAGGQVYGSTSPDGAKVEGEPTSVQQVLATVATAVRVDPSIENVSELGRPIKIVEANPIQELLS